MNTIFNKRNIHASFQIGLLLKGLFDVVEVLGGTLLIFITPERMSKLITLISKGELNEDPTDFVILFLLAMYSQSVCNILPPFIYCHME